MGCLFVNDPDASAPDDLAVPRIALPVAGIVDSTSWLSDQPGRPVRPVPKVPDDGLHFFDRSIDDGNFRNGKRRHEVKLSNCTALNKQLVKTVPTEY